MDVWIVWDIDSEYANDGELKSVFDTEEKAQTLAGKLDRDLHKQMRERGILDHRPEVPPLNVACYSNGYPKHRVSKHTVM